MSAVRIRPRAAIALAAMVGLAAFTWPLFVSPESGIVHSGDVPWTFALLLPIVLAEVLTVSDDFRE